MSQQDPFYSFSPGAGASTTYVQPIPTPAPQVSLVSHLNEPSLQAVREIVRVEVRKALNEIITEIRMQIGAKE